MATSKFLYPQVGLDQMLAVSAPKFVSKQFVFRIGLHLEALFDSELRLLLMPDLVARYYCERRLSCRFALNLAKFMVAQDVSKHTKLNSLAVYLTPDLILTFEILKHIIGTKLVQLLKLSFSVATGINSAIVFEDGAVHYR